MQLGGTLTIQLTTAAERVTDVVFASPRRFDACRVLEGLPPHEARRRAAGMFSLCGQAHGVASELAALAAASRDDGGHHAQQPDALRQLLAEASHDTLRRLFVDLPTALGARPRVDLLAPALRQLHRLRQAAAPDWDALAADLARLLARHVHGEDDRWAERTAGRWHQWLADGGTEVARWLQQLAARDVPTPTPAVSLMSADVPLDALLAAADAGLARDPRFAAQPQLGGVPIETGPLARQRDTPLIQQLVATHAGLAQIRVAAWLVELAHTPHWLQTLGAGSAVESTLAAWTGGRRCDDPDPGPAVATPDVDNGSRDHGSALRWGLGWAETARGLLLHRLALAGGIVRRYQIVAPTEWNLHPRGSLARALRQLDASDPMRLAQQARLLALAVDPCLEYRIALCPGHAP